LDLPAETCVAIRQLSIRDRISIFNVLLAAYNIVLAQWSDADEVVIGGLFSSRPRPELMPLIGYFANYCPIRTDLSGNPTHAAALQRAIAALHTAEEWQCVPYRFYRELAAARSEGLPEFTASVNSTIIDEPSRSARDQKSPLTYKPYHLRLGAEMTAMRIRSSMSLWIQNIATDRISLVVQYRAALFNPKTIATFAADFKNALECMVSDPQRRIRGTTRGYP
jgi:non-ribosomal peptide synthetase component F